ncbi:MAG: hypothetical protein J7K61_02240 [Thermoplasmata archaeon]|nr:hypothetical protein [Thermoplasmata archaeon]
MNLKLHKGVLSFLSGLGFMGLAFYLWFFTIYNVNWEIGMLFFYSLATSVLGAAVIYFLALAFSMITPKFNITPTLSGFFAGILSMAAIILILLSMQGINDILSSIHPLVTFFIAAACTYLLIIPDEEEEEGWKL